ncbi:peptidoglycan-binding protein [Roseofilum casamattae]|uniref:Peptidoglycan-binding protein n=1 Tax=Roseofilum casamattae BLCC-M143 TaxID=3022442 RepID=A0ABT7C0L2_9CYAN|nr:peptidoglycan-binding protein [Roseofilum casamattae]MDJ1184279.1 peptidoglycan-binding protein [Roseofilum casamattae BLCC-M143]
MESLALTYNFLAYEDTNLAPQLRSCLAISPTLKTATIGLIALGLTASIVGTADGALAMASRGESGLEVEYLQEQLKAAGYFPRGVASTGYFGSITEEALRHYQYDMGLVVDGVAGPQTYASLEGRGSDVATTDNHMVAATALNVRVGAGTSFPVRDVVYYGEPVSVDYINSSGWAKLSDGGWVASNYLAQG